MCEVILFPLIIIAVVMTIPLCWKMLVKSLFYTASVLNLTISTILYYCKCSLKLVYFISTKLFKKIILLFNFILLGMYAQLFINPFLRELFIYHWTCLLHFCIHLTSRSNIPSKRKARSKQIWLKLAIKENENRVIFAESDENFIDILLSFLILPMGTIIRLLGGNSGIGSMDNLYRSVLDLDEHYFMSKACRDMLLKPKSAYGAYIKDLIDDTELTKFYICAKMFCSSSRLASACKDTICRCGRKMDQEIYVEEDADDVMNGKSVFLKEGRRFLITDSLNIFPFSTSTFLEMSNMVGDHVDTSAVQMVLGEDEVLLLLKNLLVSNATLTDTFLLEKAGQGNMTSIAWPIARRIQSNGNSMNVKLFIHKSDSRVLCGGAEGGFLDLILSFLTLPLGSIINLLRKNSSLESVDNLYKSIERLNGADCFKSNRYAEILLDPKLETHFNCDSQLLPVVEEDPKLIRRFKCRACFLRNMACSKSWGQTLHIMNPKFTVDQPTGNGDFTTKDSTLLIYDDLVVRPLEPNTHNQELHKHNITTRDVKEVANQIGQREALTLLKSCLTSKSALSCLTSKSAPSWPASNSAPSSPASNSAPSNSSPLPRRIWSWFGLTKWYSSPSFPASNSAPSNSSPLPRRVWSWFGLTEWYSSRSTD